MNALARQQSVLTRRNREQSGENTNACPQLIAGSFRPGYSDFDLPCSDGKDPAYTFRSVHVLKNIIADSSVVNEIFTESN